MVKYIQKEIKFHFFLKKKNEWKKILKNTTAKWLDYIMFWKKNMKSKFFFDAYLQIRLTIMYFLSKLHVKLAVIE